MSGESIGSFDELLAHLDGLSEAAWSAEVDPRLARQLAAIRHRLVRIQAYMTGESSPGFPPPTPRRKTVQDAKDVADQFGGLADAARVSGLSSTLTHYLHNARMRFTYAQRGQEYRLANREAPEENRTGWLAWDGRKEEVTVLDTSAFGVSLRCSNPPEPDQIVELHLSDPGGRNRTFLCLVIHHKPDGKDHRVGLEIFTTKL